MITVIPAMEANSEVTIIRNERPTDSWATTLTLRVKNFETGDSAEVTLNDLAVYHLAQHCELMRKTMVPREPKKQ